MVNALNHKYLFPLTLKKFTQISDQNNSFNFHLIWTLCDSITLRSELFVFLWKVLDIIIEMQGVQQNSLLEFLLAYITVRIICNNRWRIFNWDQDNNALVNWLKAYFLNFLPNWLQIGILKYRIGCACQSLGCKSKYI